MHSKFLGSLLHLADPTLPIGGYTHSNGLETYVQKRIVKDVTTTEEFVCNMLKFNIKYNDGAFVRLAYDATKIKDLEELIKLDQECTALKCPREIREASHKLGLRVIKIFRRHQTYDFLELFEKALKEGKTDNNYSIIFGMFASLFEIPLQEALYAFYYTSAVGMITNAVKLVPLGQLDGQDILFRMQSLIEKVVGETLTLDRTLVGLCNTAFDVRCMQHERLYSRLYMS